MTPSAGKSAGTGTVRALHPDRPMLRGFPGWAYQRPAGPGASGGAIFRVTRDRDGTDQITDVLDWCPLVLARLVTLADDGTPTGVYYRLAVGQDTIIASHDEITSGKVWARCPDAYGTASRTMRDVLAGVVADQGARLDRTLAVTRTGWHPRPDGGRMYVYPDGRTYPADQDVYLVGAPARLVAAAAPPPAVADAEVSARVTAMAESGGWAPLFAVGAAARTLGQSLRPVPAALLLHGPPNAGKSCTAAAGRALILDGSQWPPVATARMSDTPTAIEMAVDLEADMPTLLDDLALTGTSSALDQRRATEIMERIIRPVGNQEAIRARSNRDLTPQPVRYVRSIPTITAQQLPADMQASLFRRAVSLYLQPGDAAVAWWRPAEYGGGDGARQSAPALRAIGDRIIARLGDAADPAALLAEADSAGLAALRPHMDRALPGWAESTTGMAGVVESAAAMLGGLTLVAEAAGLDAGPLLARVAAPLARALARQADTIDDRARAADDLATALGDVLRHALLARRAHVADRMGEVSPSSGPDGVAPPELGLRAAGRDMGLTVWEGAGVPLYWLPDRAGLGVRSESLHALVRASGDPRLSGYTVASLRSALARAGALLRNPAPAGKPWAHRVRVGPQQTPTSLLVIPARVVWPDLGADGPDDGRAVGPQTAPGQDPHGQATEDPRENAGHESTGVAPTVPTAEVSAPQTPRPGIDVPALAAGVTVHGITWIGADGASHTVDQPYRSLPDLLAALARGMGGPGTVALDAEAAALIGYPDAPTNTRPGRPGRPAPKKSDKAPACRAVAEAARAGWKHSAAGISAWTIWHGEGRPSITLVVLPWLDHKAMRVSGAEYLRADHDPLRAAYLLARYREVTGVPYVMTAGTSGTGLIRHLYGAGRPARGRRTPRLLWDGEGTPAAQVQEQACVWERTPTDDERALPWVIPFDARMAYLAAMVTAELAYDPLEHTGLPLGGWDPSLPGYWQVPGGWAPEGTAGLLPPLTGGTDSGLVWRTTPTVKLMIECGMPEEAISDAYLPEARQDTRGRPLPRGGRLLHGSPGMAEILRDGIASIGPDVTDPDEIAVRAALKATYRETVGMLRRGTRVIARPDWSDTIIATARANLLRKVIRVGQQTGRWPVRIMTDCVYYPAATDDPAREIPAGWKLTPAGAAPKLGEWGIKDAPIPMAEFLATDLHGTPREVK